MSFKITYTANNQKASKVYMTRQQAENGVKKVFRETDCQLVYMAESQQGIFSGMECAYNRRDWANI